jgi:hypothetical protein
VLAGPVSTVPPMELCPYCEEDSPLDGAGDCPRCDRRHELVDTAAYYAAHLGEVTVTKQVAAARKVMCEPRDHARSVVGWAVLTQS